MKKIFVAACCMSLMAGVTAASASSLPQTSDGLKSSTGTDISAAKKKMKKKKMMNNDMQQGGMQQGGGMQGGGMQGGGMGGQGNMQKKGM